MLRSFKMGENQKENDIFFVCALIEYIARKTKNTKKQIIEKIGKEEIIKIYNLAEVYHCENIDKVSDELIEKYNIKNGKYDILSKTINTNPPTHWDIGKVYQRLIIMISKSDSDYIDKLIEVLTSWIIPEFDNYNSSMYFENPSYILACYEEGKIL
ncbi:MAG: hypothetical protein IJV31_12485 [Clostridia bacterium]|nr:hypothetical protein [Clostridia bacterium]